MSEAAGVAAAAAVAAAAQVTRDRWSLSILVATRTPADLILEKRPFNR